MTVEVIDFSASWCFPCKLQKPIMEKLGKKYKKAEFKEIDIDANKDKAKKNQVRAVPTIIIKKDGEELNRFVGVTDEKQLEKSIEKALK